VKMEGNRQNLEEIKERIQRKIMENNGNERAACKKGGEMKRRCGKVERLGGKWRKDGEKLR
jgi:hypothetical protein